MKINTVRGILLLAGVALVVAKLAGVIAWPWLAVLVPLIAWGYPWIAGLTALAVYGVLGMLTLVFVLIMGAIEAINNFYTRRRRAREIAAGRAVRGIWDHH